MEHTNNLPNIPFSPPRMDEKIINEVIATLKSGWITTGPRTKTFEKQIAAYCGCSHVLALNSATAGLEIMLRWFGIGAGDEVILPAYTYSATANVIVHCGATPVFVDSLKDHFNLDPQAVEKAITERTKVIMPVDFSGWPCDYDALYKIVHNARSRFKPSSPQQHELGRMLVLSDSAHSFGATYKNKIAGTLADASVFSFHAVKNLTTAEGGAIALNLPLPFDNEAIYKALCIKILHGQTKDALAKTQPGQWRYDIIEAGYKFNMTDISAAIGLIELERYNTETLPRRKAIMDRYNTAFMTYKNWILPQTQTSEISGSHHLYPLRIMDISEAQRDAIIQYMGKHGIAVNVHFIPVPHMSFYKSLGFSLQHYPNAQMHYWHEISLPIFYDLTDAQQDRIILKIMEGYHQVCA
ncbi:MAG: DegT/DnrJ/EryC1/StrS family aminotransferase [Bacteroidia bacterium]|jgi:dTDP-4-amino-4,6-dideoxygalactose transaminase|nr:DegT/DnrJ/EryC1/StrS aminotransferase family protein [Sphingobacteriia bacterium]